jgi:D-alanine-D-alanine ligase
VRVLVWHDVVPPGAPPDQLDVLDQVAAVCAALTAHEVIVEPFSGELRTVLAWCPDVVVNLVESFGGEGRLIHLAPAALETLGVPFTGSGAAALAVTSHKQLSRRVMAAQGVPVPAAWTPQTPPGSLFIVKSLWEDASFGLDDDCVVDAAEVPAAVERLRARLGGAVVVEAYVEGRELNVSLFDRGTGLEALPVAEIAFDLPAGRRNIMGYAAKWDERSAAYRGTPRTFDVSDDDAARAAAVAMAAARAVGARGFARVDLRVDAAGRMIVLEVNANPCLSPDAGFAAAAARAGLSLEDVVRRLVEHALEVVRVHP